MQDGDDIAEMREEDENKFFSSYKVGSTVLNFLFLKNNLLKSLLFVMTGYS